MTDAEAPKDVETPMVDEPVVEKEGPSRKDRPTGSTHFGDVDFNEEGVEEIGDATWYEVYQTCCCHTPQEWGIIACFMVLVLTALYFFLFGLDMLGNGAKILTGCTSGSILKEEQNPVAGLMIGILATVLLQSSSTTTSIVVSLVGEEVVNTKNGIYMIMGANIGTSVTNTIVSLGFLGDGDNLERAFAGAVVHDMFNFLSVAIMLPLEAATGVLYHFTNAITPATVSEGEKWEGPIKKIVGPLTKEFIIVNKDVTKKVALGTAVCDDFFPADCKDGERSYAACKKGGLISCNKKTGGCPAFFRVGASKTDDMVSGFVCLFIGLVVLIVCLIILVTVLQKMLLGTSTRIIYKATNVNGYIGIGIGCALTILVQSSSITTSALTPLVGMGVIHLEQMFPLTLGANIGTTVTGLLAAQVSGSKEALQVALAHLFFNIFGIIIWYPIPRVRQIPLGLATKLGKATRVWRGFPLVYLFLAFFLFPIVLLGISLLFDQNSPGFKVLGVIVVIFIVVFLGIFAYKWKYQGLDEAVLTYMEGRQARRMAYYNLPTDMAAVKQELARLKEHTGLPDEVVEEEIEEAVEKELVEDDIKDEDEA